MPGSKIEAELSKATKVKQGAKEDRQSFLTELCAGIQNLSDAKWEALSDEAQEWANAAATAVKGKKKIKDFPDVGSVPADDDEDDKPAKKKRRAEPEEEEEEEEEEEAPKKKKKPAKEEPEEEEEEEEEEEKPAAGASKTSAPPKASGSGIKDSIKEAIFNDPEISVDDLVKKLGKSGSKVSKVTVSNIRAEYRHTIKFLKGKGAKGIEAK